MSIKSEAIVMMLTTAGLISAAQAQDGIKLGDAVLAPFVRGEMTFDDNVFHGADKKSDSFLQATAGAKLSKETDSMMLDSSAWFSQRKYNKYDEKDATRWGVAGLGKLSSDKSSLTGMVSMRQVEDYDDAPAYGAVPTGFEGTVDKAFDRTSSNVKRTLCDVAIGGSYQLFEEMSVQAAYTLYSVDYDDATDGWYENTIGGETRMGLTDKNDLFMNLQFGMQDGDGAPDGAHFTTMRAGVRSSVSDKTMLRLGLGATHYKTDDETFSEPSFEADGTWQATEKVSLFINGRNQIQPVGTGSDVQLVTRAGTGVRYQATEELSLILSGSLVYDKELDDASEPVHAHQTTTVRANYHAASGLHLFAMMDFTDANSDTSADYERFKATLGAGYKF